MPLHSMIRIFSLLFTVWFAWQVPDQITLWSIVWCLGFGHYFIGLWYSRRLVRQVSQDSQTLYPFIVVLAMGTILFFARFSLTIYFAIHHAFNEVYMLNRTMKNKVDLTGLRTSGVFLHLFLYAVLLRYTPTLMLIDPNILFVGLGISYLAFFFFLFRLRNQLSREELINNSCMEILGLALIPLADYASLSIFHIAFYHFVSWCLIPLQMIARQGKKSVFNYLGVTLLVTGGIFFLTPIGLDSLAFSKEFMGFQFVLWSFIHITISFGLSKAHPQWITKWFTPQEISAKPS